jgi:hypothetical protein
LKQPTHWATLIAEVLAWLATFVLLIYAVAVYLGYEASEYSWIDLLLAIFFTLVTALVLYGNRKSGSKVKL